MRRTWLFIALIAATVLAVLQYAALAEHWYWYFTWFDTVMHFLGGFTVAAFAIALSETKRPILFLFGMILIAIGWEVFELLINAEREANFVFDTALDLLMDTIGMTLAYGAARLSLWRSV